MYATDQRIGEVLQALNESGQRDQTMVLITSDHGQEFHDLGKGHWEHPTNFAAFQTRVPLVVWHPEWGAGQVDYPTSHYDVVPTIMQSVLGAENALEAYTVGKHLLTESSSRAFYRQTILITPQWMKTTLFLFMPVGRIRYTIMR